jgi:hypothetical protein
MPSYVVEVNEGVVEASCMGVTWWYDRRPLLEQSGKLRDVKPACLIAGVVEISCDNKEDAEFMARHMIEVGGMPASAVKVKKGRNVDA